MEKTYKMKEINETKLKIKKYINKIIKKQKTEKHIHHP